MIYIAIVSLIAMSALFSATETAFSSVNKIRLKHLASQGNKGAKRALVISDKFDKALTTILVGNNIVNITSASLGTILFTSLLGESGVLISTVVMTILVLTFGEILPKSFAKQNAEKLAIAFAGILNFFMFILTPIVIIFMFLQKIAAKIYKSDNSSPSVTEDELKYIIEEIEDEGVLEEKESDLVRSALEFDEIAIEQILVPRVKVTAIERNEDIDKILGIFIRDRYSRIPVYDKSIDNIIGILHEKDFFELITQTENKLTSIENIIQKALYVSEMKVISEVMYEMQRTKIHMAIVKDQYGGTSGIVTMEDIIEELVGEIYDETDEIIPSIIKLGDNEYEVQGDLNIGDLKEALELPDDIIESDSITVSGWVMELFESIPEIGSKVKNGIFTVSIIDADDQYVKKVGLSLVTDTE